jgi:hypothetical protein
MTTSITGIFKNIGHFFATAVSKFLVLEPKIEHVATEVAADAPVVEAVTAAVPVYGPLAVPIEKAGVMALGAIVGVLHALGAAAEAKLLDAGLDITAIQTAQDVYTKLPGQIKTLVASNAAPTPAP